MRVSKKFFLLFAIVALASGAGAASSNAFVAKGSAWK